MARAITCIMDALKSCSPPSLSVQMTNAAQCIKCQRPFLFFVLYCHQVVALPVSVCLIKTITCAFQDVGLFQLLATITHLPIPSNPSSIVSPVSSIIQQKIIICFFQARALRALHPGLHSISNIRVGFRLPHWLCRRVCVCVLHRNESR